MKKQELIWGVKAREYAVKEFDVNNVVSRHLEIYNSLMVNKV